MNTAAPGLIQRIIQLFEKIPYSLIAFVARFSIAAVFMAIPWVLCANG